MNRMEKKYHIDERGFFGRYGGAYVPVIRSKHIGARDVAKVLAVVDNHDVVFV